ncbi:hypothetical protein OS493_037627 [Desmophyllum pertusum]|uniref:Uncharacterized protein n=1 Tax=Desmophyllum pertusum TaxID=174260 RepID=A0A9W9ZI12_9CNID|nr:hypothetical protein OS493_037627 [Desmophyllum pertusum]
MVLAEKKKLRRSVRGWRHPSLDFVNAAQDSSTEAKVQGEGRICEEEAAKSERYEGGGGAGLELSYRKVLRGRAIQNMVSYLPALSYSRSRPNLA